jgi:ABC-type glycerol-3-phosphate transport system permease component
MKRTVVFCAAALLVIGAAVLAFGDIARPKTTPTPEAGKVVFHTGLQVVPDSKAYEARLQISQATLQNIREATNNMSANTSMTQRLMQSSTRTMMAGLFMFLAISFAGVWLARATKGRSRKAIAAALLIAGFMGAATVLVRANAGPPGYYYWQKLPENLNKGQGTRGGLDIEIVPGSDGITLIVPMKNSKTPGEE